MSVYKKLSDAREAFHSTALKKTGQNKFAGYSYFELGDFLIPALRIFKEHGLLSVTVFDKDVASMSVIDIEKPESVIVFTSPFGGASLKGAHEIQNIGAVETYQRRYLWVAALEIVEHDALDATTGAKGDAPIVTPKGGIGDDLPEDQKTYLQELARWATAKVAAGEVTDVLNGINEAALEADQRVYMDRWLDSKTRAAIKRK